MKGVGPGFERHIHHGAGFPSVFRWRILNQVELLNGIDRENCCRVARDSRAIDDALTGERFAVEKSIDDVRVVFSAQPVGAGCGESAAGIAHHSRAQLQQIFVVAAIQRKLVDFLVAESSPQS